MSNEELAALIQQGHKEYILPLFEQIQNFLAAKAYRYFNRFYDVCARCGVTVDDIEQEEYFAMMEAVQYFKPDSGNKFLTYCNYPLANHFRVLTGIRTSKREPLNDANSLDAPLSSDDEAFTLVDTIPDKNSAAEFDGIEDKVYRAELHDTLEKGIRRLSEPQQTVIRCRYYQNKTLEQTANEVGCKRDGARQHEAKALRTLRTTKISRELRPFLYDEVYSSALKGTGLQAFKNTQASSVERVFERLDDQRTRRANRPA